jgi:3-methylfumaryl-CoA hydratase
LPDDFAAWIGRTETMTDTITPRQARLMAATLDYSADATEAVLTAGVLPPLWHWTAFVPDTPMSQLGPDGHAKRGGFLPPVPLERRMWAGGRLVFHNAALPLGVPMERHSEILSITEKEGGSGRLVFVTVAHRISGPNGLAIEEEQDIVYIAIPDQFSPPPSKPAPTAPTWAEDVPIDAVRLFRYSALTFNGHRIHYDMDYTREHEKYPGLVVHGPLQATLMLEGARRNATGQRPARFSFRGMRPLFHFEDLRVTGHADTTGTAVHAVNGDGLVTMQGRVDWV